MKLNVDEIYEIAEQIERNGAIFYRQAADMTTEPEAKKLLQSLAAMEDEHEKTFAQLRAQVVQDDERRETFYEGDDSVAQYLQAYANTQVFNKAGEPFGDLAGDESLRQILDKAMMREKEAIIFFGGVKETMHNEDDKQRVDMIIKEEYQHIAMLADEMNRLAG